MSDRPYDVVMFGATGFTGALTAEYLAANAPEGMRWALAGRNPEKLARVAEGLGAEAPTLRADVEDADSIRELAECTKVVITTVGPYIKYGEPLVAACAAAGTGYLDLTGEPEFVDKMYLKHHATAAGTGARLIHAAGFDSIPHDLGAQFTVEQLPEGVPIEIHGFVRAGGRPSGGTFHSAVTIFGRARQGLAASRERRAAEPQPVGRRIKNINEKPHRDAEFGWVLPMPTVDPQILCRSAAALDRYGPDFAYGHNVVVKHLPIALGAAVGVPAFFLATQIPPARNLMLKAMDPGTGPTPEQRAKGWFKVRFRGEGGGARVETEVSGGDPGYGDTSKMLAEAAMCLALDDLPETAGQVTTAQALGPALRERLDRAGITFRVV